MSLLTQKQIEEIQKIHDDIGECTFPHEECFIKELIEWNEKQTAQTGVKHRITLFPLLHIWHG